MIIFDLNLKLKITAMKVIIENAVNINIRHTEVALSYFNELLTVITISKTRDELTELMTNNINLEQMQYYFAYGFGGSHMWVKQVINDAPAQQVIFVEF